MRKFLKVGMAASLSMLLLTACDRNQNGASPTTSVASAPAPVEVRAPAASRPIAPERSLFVDRIWMVPGGSPVMAGTTYEFRDDGVLVIDAPTGHTTTGEWTYDNNALVMVEEGVAYPTDIFELNDERFRIRSNSPGQPVEITLVPPQ